jgi:hypothetical protein
MIVLEQGAAAAMEADVKPQKAAYQPVQLPLAILLGCVTI